MRMDTFSDRLRRAKRKRRRSWLTWRISWRQRLLHWLITHKAKLTKKAIIALDKAYDKGSEHIPWDKVGERYDSWVRKFVHNE